MENRSIMIVSSVLAILVIVGCTTSMQKPQAASFPTSKMQSMQSAQNWDLVAENLSKNIDEKYRLLPTDLKRALFVDATDNSIFSQSLKNLLVTHLVKKGIPITTNSALASVNCSSTALSCNPLHMKLDSQMVPHDGKTIPYPFKVDSLPTIASYVIYLVGDYWTAPAWAILPLSTYIKNYSPPETNTEILVNAWLIDNDNVVFTDTSIYYVNDDDKSIYEGHKFDSYIDPLQTNSPLSASMKRAALSAAALNGRCDNDSGFELTATLAQQGYRMETYEVQCKKSKLIVNCEEYNSCHVVY